MFHGEISKCIRIKLNLKNCNFFYYIMLSIETIIELYSSGNIEGVYSKEEVIKSLMEYVKVPTKTKRKKIKDPNCPKRPTSSYMIWLNANRSEIKSTYFSDYDSVENWDIESKTEYYISKGLNKPVVEGKPKIVVLVTSKAGLIWKSMTSEDKEEYETQFKNAKEQYNIAKESYNPEISMLDMRNEDIQIKTPEGWEGPHINMCIDKTIKGVDGKTIRIFNTFEEAVKKADELDNKCYGITQTKRGFSVRQYCRVLKEKDGSIASWTKKEFVNPIKHNKELDMSVKSKKTNELTGINVDDTDDSDCEMEVNELEIEGTTYYLNESTGELYDPETSECVGKYVDGKLSN